MRRPITIKHEMERLASHSGLIHIAGQSQVKIKPQGFLAGSHDPKLP